MPRPAAAVDEGVAAVGGGGAVAASPGALADPVADRARRGNDDTSYATIATGRIIFI